MFTLACDHDRCGARWPGVAPGVAQARDTASGQGWAHYNRLGDLCPRHATQARRGQPRVPVCDPATLDDCVECGGGMHRVRDKSVRRRCAGGHGVHAGRGVCVTCTDRARRGHKPSTETPRDVLLDAWTDLSEVGVGFDEFARLRGMDPRTWRRAFERARADGDPRAVRLDRGEQVAA